MESFASCREPLPGVAEAESNQPVTLPPRDEKIAAALTRLAR